MKRGEMLIEVQTFNSIKYEFARYNFLISLFLKPKVLFLEGRNCFPYFILDPLQYAPQAVTEKVIK